MGSRMHKDQVHSAILELSLVLSSSTMTDYGVSRLEELTIKQCSSDNTSISARLDDIIESLSNLAVSLRNGEFRPKAMIDN